MKKNNSGFFLIIVIIIILILGLFSIIVWKITDSDLYFIDNKIVSYDDSTNKKNIENIVLKYSDITNTNGFGKDELFCSGGVIYIDKNSSLGSTCLNGEFTNGSDNIDDKGNNDDFKGNFSTGVIDSLVTIDSRKNDDDDIARKNVIGIIPPLKEQTLLYINDKLNEAVSFNKNNFGDYIETEVLNNINNLTLNISLNNNSGSIEIFQIDKNIYNQTKEIIIISQKKGEIKTLSGYIINNGDINNIGDPYIFDIKNYDYAINVTNNNLDEVLTYEINGLSNNKKDVYLVGLDDSNGFNNRKYLFQELIKNYFGYSLRNGEY